MDLLEGFRKNWVAKRFVSGDGKVLLAVSGGLDSMVMADLFLRSGLVFGVAHCNFKLRGEEADLDEEHVRQWALQNNIPFYITRFDTAARSVEWKKGIQETARILRYEWLDNIRRQEGYTRLATAHHANDNAETLLINLFRGTGISGIHGIPEINDNTIRPLLFATREAIRQYASERSVSWREDASNSSDKYLRNAVRNEVIPVAEKYFPGLVTQLNDSIRRFGEVERIYNKAIEQERKKLVEQRGADFYIPVRKLKDRSPLQTICYELFRPFGFSAAQSDQLMNLLDADSGHYVNSGTHKAIKDRDFIILTSLAQDETDFIAIEGAPCKIEAGIRHFHFTIVDKSAPITDDPGTALVDLGRVEFPLILRKWKTGDYFYPLGMGMKKKKLSRFFIDQKLPLHEKDQVWVLETGRRIVWVAGMRLDERFKITPGTHRILKVSMKKA